MVPAAQPASWKCNMNLFPTFSNKFSTPICFSLQSTYCQSIPCHNGATAHGNDITNALIYEQQRGDSNSMTWYITECTACSTTRNDKPKQA